MKRRAFWIVIALDVLFIIGVVGIGVYDDHRKQAATISRIVSCDAVR